MKRILAGMLVGLAASMNLQALVHSARTGFRFTGPGRRKVRSPGGEYRFTSRTDAPRYWHDAKDQRQAAVIQKAVDKRAIREGKRFSQTRFSYAQQPCDMANPFYTADLNPFYINRETV